MRVGNVFGPFYGLYWLNVAERRLTVRQGRDMGEPSAEIVLDLTETQLSDLLEALLPEPVQAKARRPSRARAPLVGEQPTRTTLCRDCKGALVYRPGHGRPPVRCDACRIARGDRRERKTVYAVERVPA